MVLLYFCGHCRHAIIHSLKVHACNGSCNLCLLMENHPQAEVFGDAMFVWEKIIFCAASVTRYLPKMQHKYRFTNPKYIIVDLEYGELGPFGLVHMSIQRDI